jgi:hypothetical protein
VVLFGTWGTHWELDGNTTRAHSEQQETKKNPEKPLALFFRVQAIDQRHTKHKYIHTLFIYYIYIYMHIKRCVDFCVVY